MGTQPQAETEFNQIQFEKRLTSLKDSQENINACCQWCLENRVHHKKIVNIWLNVLKRVKIEQRLVLFYLANDVIQYSKRRKYEFVDSWGIALQKATTMVRDEKVKHKVLRIFNIWQQRNVYDDEFIADLCGLINVSPAAPKNDEPHEFQSNQVIRKIRYCSSLEADTDMKLKVLKEHNPKIQIESDMISSLKDRAHVDDVEKEVDVYASHMEDYINALKLEIKNRLNLISVLRHAETQLETDKKDVKVVANAYRMFAVRVKTFQKKLDEHKDTLVSPIPSPDIDAPSPSPDSDIDLPDADGENDQASLKNSDIFSDYPQNIEFSNPGYYNPVPAPTTESSSNFVANGYTSFIGGSVPFSIADFDPSTIFSNSQSNTTNTQTTNSVMNKPLSSSIPTMVQPPPMPMDTLGTARSTSPYQFKNEHLPLLPPPMPPFSSKNETDYSNNTYSYTTAPTTDYSGGMQYDSSASAYPSTADNNYNSLFNSSQATSEFELNNYSSSNAYEAPPGANPYPPSNDEYNPEQELDTWDADNAWMNQQQVVEADTPESPPMFEKEGYGDPIEYHDTVTESGVEDIDQRVIPIIPIESDDSLGRGQDVDHRNLISLTGSPADSNSNIPSNDGWNSQVDQDYRNPPGSVIMDQDYRLPPFNIEQLKLPPPPPPPPKTAMNPIPTITTITTITTTPRIEQSEEEKMEDIVESIDMDLSDDENLLNELQKTDTTNLKVVVDNVEDSLEEPSHLTDTADSSQDGGAGSQLALEPPPPFPDLPDDEDANAFLDNLDHELNSSDFNASLGDDFPDISKDELIQDDIFESMESMQLPNLPNLQLNPPPNFPDLSSPPIVPPPNLNNVPSMLPPPPMMTMPSLDFTLDPPINPPVLCSNPPFPPPRGRGFSRPNHFRGNFSGERGNFSGERVNFSGDRGNFGEERGNFNSEHGNFFNDERGNFNEDRSHFNDERNNFIDERGNFDDERGNFNSERGNFNSERGHFNSERGNFNSGRGSFNSERGNFNGERGNFNGERGNFNGGRGNFNNNQPNFMTNPNNFIMNNPMNMNNSNRGNFHNNRGNFNNNRGIWDRGRGRGRGFRGNRGRGNFRGNFKSVF